MLHDRLVSCPTQDILPWLRYNAIDMANSLKESDLSERKKHFRRIQDWTAKHDPDVLVISSEFFASAKPSVLQEALDTYVPDDLFLDTRVISYVRPHASRFLAAFVQRTKTGLYFGDIDSFLASLQKNKPITFNYTKRFRRWKRVFGDNFTLKPFIRSEMYQGDISQDFFHEVLEGAPFEIEKPVEANVSVSTKSLAGLRRMHEKFRELGMDAKGRSLIGGAMGNHFLASQANGGQKPKLDPATAEALIATYKKDAAKLDSTFFDRPIMQEALEHCVDDTQDTKVDITAELHFTQDELRSLDKIFTSVAGDMRLYRRLWALHHHTGHRNVRNQDAPPARVLLKLRRISKKINSIDDQLFEAAEILTG